MSGDCLECGQNTQWVGELGSSVCTTCGTLTNSTQTSLGSQADSYETSSSHEGSFAWDLGNPTLKSIRNKDGRALSGQSREVRHRQNMFSTYAFITSLCNRLSYPALTNRAQTLFSQAMSKGQFRWGRKAKLTAGASASIAARESHKSVSLRDISALIEEPLPSITKTYNEVVKLFGFGLEMSDPSVHLTTLYAHLTRIISDSKTFELPKNLASVVRSLQPRLSCVLRTAESLAALVTRSGKVSHLATAPTACGIFLLALEGEIRTPLPNCSVLGQFLGARFDVKQGVVMDRYRVLYGIIEDWIKQVPWLQPSTQLRTRAPPSRSKVTTRGAVAKGLNDVVQFQEEIWKKSLYDMEKVSLDLDLIDECDGTGDRMTPIASHDDGEDDNDCSSVTSTSASTVTTASSVTKRKSVVSSREASVELISRPIKKRRTRHDRSMECASQFLLDPIKSSKATDDNQLLSHLLSSDSSSLSHTFAHPPTRLQLLRAARPGGPDAIADEELFEDGELEAMFRTEEEVNLLVQLVDWDDAEEYMNQALSEPRNRPASSTRNSSQLDSPQRGAGRIDMDAFERLMDPTSDLDSIIIGCVGVGEESLLGDPRDEGVTGDRHHWFSDSSTASPDIDSRSPAMISPKRVSPTHGLDAQLGGIEEEEDWRPLSPDPGGIGFGSYDSLDYYDL